MSQSQVEAPRWEEKDSEEFIDHGRYFVPEREVQIATLCALVPPPPPGADFIDLCCGEGLICEALLGRFPQARVHGYDGSQRMLETSTQKLSAYGSRYHTRLFDLGDRSWRTFETAPHAFFSSLAIHHLDSEEKHQLFRDLFAALAPGGALIIADLIEPASKLGNDVAADQWDDAVRKRAQELDGNLDAFQRFEEIAWNNYRLTEPDEIDKPSSLLDQLRWMEQVGFVEVDAHWMQAGHVIFSGYKPA